MPMTNTQQKNLRDDFLTECVILDIFAKLKAAMKEGSAVWPILVSQQMYGREMSAMTLDSASQLNY